MIWITQNGFLTYVVKVSFGRRKTIMDLSISCRFQAPTCLRTGGKLEAVIKTDVAKWQAERASESESSRWIQIINKDIDMEGR